jgi:hypothetical protein
MEKPTRTGGGVCARARSGDPTEAASVAAARKQKFLRCIICDSHQPPLASARIVGRNWFA